MNDYNLFSATNEQEKELVCILLNSSLYQDMSPEDKQKLLNYLVTSYFSILSERNNRALPAVIQCGPTI
jgi:hypothetical protein